MRNNFSQWRQNKQTFTDKEVLTFLEQGSIEENRVLAYLYKTVKISLIPFIISNNGTLDDAEDVLQDAIIVFYEKVKSQEFRLQTTIMGYIYSVGKYIWLNKLKKIGKEVSLSDEIIKEVKDVDFDIEVYDTNLSEYTETILGKMQERCKQILIDSIYKKMSMKEIAEAYGLKSDQIARNKKYKCLQSLRTIIEKSGYLSKRLIEIKL